MWRVVVFTYNHQGDAEKKAQSVNQKHPNLNASVFSPAGNGPYLVTLGGAMTREEAQQLRRKALREGMPRDSYIQNYKQ